MPMILGGGERLESRHRVQCVYGHGTLYVTSWALAIDVTRRGVVFHRAHYQMAGIEATGRKKIKVTWPEEGAQLHEFEFKVGGPAAARDVVEAIRKKHDYAGNCAPGGVTWVPYDDEDRRRVLGRREDWMMDRHKGAEERLAGALCEWGGRMGEDGDDDDDDDDGIAAASDHCRRDMERGRREVETALDNAEMWRWCMLNAHGIKARRSTRIPAGVPDHLCWNDCWLDEWAGAFCTFNNFWTGGRFESALVYGGRTDRETGAYAIPARYVRFFHGMPYVASEGFVKRRYEIGVFVQTISDDEDDVELMILAFRVRRRRGMKGYGWDGKVPAALLSFMYDARKEEDLPIKGRHRRFGERYAEFFYRRGIIEDEAVAGRGWPKPTEEEIERLLDEDDARIRRYRFLHYGGEGGGGGRRGGGGGNGQGTDRPRAPDSAACGAGVSGAAAESRLLLP